MAANNFKIDFVGVGAPRCATTWLSNCLAEHPQIVFSSPKETHFFDKEYNFKQGLKFYQKFFLTEGKSGYLGEFTPSYFRSPEIARRIKNFFPKVKVIVCLRNPIERAVSHYVYDYQRGMTSKKFSDIMRDYKKDENRYIGDGFYFNHLSKFLKYFKRENVLILFYDDIKKHPSAVIKSVYGFLGVDQNFTPLSLRQKANQTISAHYRFLFINRLINTRKKIKNYYLGRIFIKILKKFKVNSLVKWILNLNKYKHTSAGSASAMNKELFYKYKDKLRIIYLEDIQNLEKLLGCNLRHWYE